MQTGRCTAARMMAVYGRHVGLITSAGRTFRGLPKSAGRAEERERASRSSESVQQQALGAGSSRQSEMVEAERRKRSEDRPRSRSGSGFLFPRLGPCERFSRCRLHTPTVLPRPCSLTLAAAACSLRVPRRGWLPTAAHVRPDLNARRALSRAPWARIHRLRYDINPATPLDVAWNSHHGSPLHRSRDRRVRQGASISSTLSCDSRLQPNAESTEAN